MIVNQTRSAISAALDWLVPNRLMRFAFVDQVVASGGNFVSTILLARALGMYELGRFTLAWMLVEIVGSLQFAAIIEPMLNIGPKQAEEDRGRYYHAVIIQQGAACGLVGPLVGIGFVLFGWLTSDAKVEGLALPLCAAIISYQLYEFFRRYLFARGRPAAGLSIDMLRFGVQLGAIWALPHAWPSATAEAGIWIVTAACALPAVQGARLFGGVAWNTVTFRSVLTRHWHFSKWLLPSALMYWTTSQSYIAVAGLVLGAETTGALKAAGTITGVLNLLLLSLSNFAPVQASHALHVGGPIALRRYIERLTGLTVGLIIAFVAVLNIAPEYIVHLLYGGHYKDVSEFVRLLCIPVVVYGLGAVLLVWAAALEQTRLIFWSYVVATPVNLIAAFPFVHYWGVTGLMLCSLLVESVRVALLLVPFARWSRARTYGAAQISRVRGDSVV